MLSNYLNRKKTDPYTPIFTGVKKLESICTQQFIYNKKEYTEQTDLSPLEIKGFSDTNNRYWLNVHGIHKADLIRKLCEKLNIHSLAIQDILDINQRPKFQDYEDYWFFL